MTAFEAITEGHHLIRRLKDHNPWWTDGPFVFRDEGRYQLSHHADLRSDFYYLPERLATNQFSIISGPAMIGKSTLLYDLIAACIDSDFREKHLSNDPKIEENLTEIVGDLDFASARQFLYVPLFEEPLYQIQAGEQLDAAIEHFKNTIRPPENADLVLLLDDVQALLKSKKKDSDGLSWVNVVDRVLREGWSVLLTTTAPRRTWNTVQETLQDVNTDLETGLPTRFEESVRPMVPWKYRDFLEYRYPKLRHHGHGKTSRFSGSSIRNNLEKVIADTNEEPEELTKQLDQFVDTLTDNIEQLPDIDWNREVTLYTFLGGTLGIRLADDRQFPLSLSHSGDEGGELFDQLSERGGRFDELRSNMLTQYRDQLHRLATNSDINLEDPDDLERILGLIAYLLLNDSADDLSVPSPVSSISFGDLADTLTVDRRTLRKKYLQLLSELYLLTESEEYDNQRPKTVRIYPRDFGILHALVGQSFNEFDRSPSQKRALEKVAAFDHTMRLTYTLNDSLDPKRGRVKFWPDEDGSIDFVPRFGGRPVPIVLSDVGSFEELSLTESPITTFDRFFRRQHDSEQDPIKDQHATALPDENLVERRVEYVQSDSFAGSKKEESRSGAPVATDGAAPFSIILTRGSDAPVEDQVAVHHHVATKPVIEIPLWLYLLFS